ncbi:MAG: O-antigen ligase family protein, partial [Firmicutes bacterium]|nr:O-antigen ligase family protein [Bacillota bacterium]
WLCKEPVWVTSHSVITQKVWKAVFPAPHYRKGRDKPGFLTSSFLSPAVTNGAWLLLLPLSAYPFIDYALRLGKHPGNLAGTWDDLFLFFCLIVAAARIACRGLGSYRKTDLHLPLFIYFGIFTFLFLLRSPETHVGIEGVRVYLEYALWFFVGVNLPDNQQQIKRFTACLVFACTVAALYGIGQYIAGVPVPANWVDQAEAGVRSRAFSVVGSPNILGSLTALVLPLSIAGFFTASTWRPRLGYTFATSTLVLCLFLTYSRGAWLAAFIGLVIFALLTNPRLLWAVGAVAAAAPIASPGIAGRLLYLFSTGYLVSSERSGRVARWQAAVEKLLQHPVVGEGFGRFGGAVATRAIPGSFYVDNFYLKTAAESGLLGLATLVWVFASAWRAGYRAFAVLSRPAEKTLAAAILSGLTAVLLHNLVENVFETPLMSTFFWLLLGFLLALPKLQRDVDKVTDACEYQTSRSACTENY